MTPGQAMLAAGIAAALLIGAAAVYRGQWPVAFACVAVAWAICLTRVFKYGLPDDLQFAAWAALWVAVGGAVIRRGISAESRPVAIAGGLCVASGIAYAGAWVWSSPTVFGTPAMAAADLFVIAALGALVWGATGGRRNRVPAGQWVHSSVSGMVHIRGRDILGRADSVAEAKARERRRR